MSRRLREEDRKALQTKQEEEEEEDKLKLLKQKIAAPIVWARLGCGVRIQDLREGQTETVVQIMKDHYINHDVLCRNAEICNDEVSLKSLVERIIFVIKDTTSLIAIDDSTNEVVGFILMKVVHKSEYGQIFSRITMNKGVAMQKLITIEATVIKKNDIYEKYDCESYAQVFYVVVIPQYRKKGIGYQLFKTMFDLSRNVHQKIVVACIDSGVLQRKAKKLGMETIDEITYVEWRGKEGDMIFDDPGAGNYSFMLMIRIIPEIPPPKPAPAPPLPENEKKEKSTRAEKMQERQKQKKKK